jgi:hypothetical protein
MAVKTKQRGISFTLFGGFFFLALSIVLMFINYNIYKNKNEGYVYSLVSYYDVYYPKPLKVVESFTGVNSESMELIMEPPNPGSVWIVQGRDSVPRKNNINPKIYLPVKEEAYIEDFRITEEGTNFSFTVTVQRQHEGDVHIINSSIPVTDEQLYSFDDFCNVTWVDAKDQDTVYSILKNDLLIDTCKTTLDKISVICSFLKNSLKKPGNIDFVYQWNNYSAWFIYSKGATGESSLQCNEYSEVFYLFANVAGIKTRRLGVAGWAESDGVVKLSGHHFNESFIPEQQKWAFVDLTSDKAYVINDTGQVLNTYELFVSNISKNYEGLKVMSTIYDSLTIQPYKDVRENEQYYFNRDCVIQYKFGDNRFKKVNQAKRYLYDPEPVLSLNYTNRKLYIKYILLSMNLLTLMLFTTFIMMWFLNRRGRK